MFELAGVGKGQVDPCSRRFLRVNRHMCEITGYTADELYGMTFSEITHPDDRDRDLRPCRRHLRRRASRTMPSKRYAQGRHDHLGSRDGDGDPRCRWKTLSQSGVIQDISARQRGRETPGLRRPLAGIVAPTHGSAGARTAAFRP